MSENVGYIPNEIAIFHRNNDQQNHWVFRGTNHFQVQTQLFPGPLLERLFDQSLQVFVHRLRAWSEKIYVVRWLGSWVISHVPMFHITQPWSVYGLLDGYYKVMSNSPKMGHLPIPGGVDSGAGFCWNFLWGPFFWGWFIKRGIPHGKNIRSRPADFWNWAGPTT